MSIRQDDRGTEAARYCSTRDVARYLRGNDALFDDDFKDEAETDPGEPSKQDVVKHIEKWTARFDRTTGQSFRENHVIDAMHDHERLYYWLSGHPIKCMKRNIKTPLDSSKGDKLEVWTGSKWEDWVARDDYKEGRNEEYWVDSGSGIIFIYERAILRPHPKFRVSYRYGRESIPADVRDAVAARVAADLVNTDMYGTVTPGTNNAANRDPDRAVREWKEEWHEVANDYKKVHAVWDI